MPRDPPPARAAVVTTDPGGGLAVGGKAERLPVVDGVATDRPWQGELCQYFTRERDKVLTIACPPTLKPSPDWNR
jgi:hypothetical protein